MPEDDGFHAMTKADPAQQIRAKAKTRLSSVTTAIRLLKAFSERDVDLASSKLAGTLTVGEAVAPDYARQ